MKVKKEPKSKLEQANELYYSIDLNIKRWANTPMPYQYQELRDDAAKESRKQLEDLKGDLADPEKVDTAYEKLVDLNKRTNAAKMLTAAVNATSDLNDKPINPQAIVETGIDAIRVAWNLATGLLFDKDKTASEKMMGFAKGCVNGVIGMCQGAVKGYEQGQGFFDTAAKMFTGSFEQGMSGYSKSIATSLLGEKERGQQIVKDLEAAHEKVLNDSDTSPIKLARKEIIKEEQRYLDDLKGKLEKGEDLSNTVRSLELLQLSNAGTSIQSTCLSALHHALLGHNREVDSKILEKLGKDTVNITESVNDILNDSSRSMPSKLLDMTKDYGSAAVEGIKSFVEGFSQGKGLKEKAVNALVSGFSVFMSKFSENLKETASRPPKASRLESDTDIEMQPMSSLKSTTDHMEKVSTTMGKLPCMEPPQKSPEAEVTTTHQDTVKNA